MIHGPAHQLVLLRHAKAEHPASLDDAMRPLALAGRTQATEVGVGLRAAGVQPDLVLVSSAVRTRQTWDRVRAGLDLPPEVARVSDALYDAGVRSLLALLREVDESAGTVLVVGHEPTVSQTAAALAGPGSDDAAVARVRVGVPTAAYSVLEVPTPWSQLEPDSARLLRVVTPA
ncbi:SixA phosphatase family protein [Cellulomonas sp. Marseille-Q8402]